MASGESWIEELKNGSANNRLPWQFNAKELDETGLYYYGARYYNPRAGVWMSPDPILAQYMQGEPVAGVFNPSNLAAYTYAWNNPVKVKDGDGRCSECTFSALRETPQQSIDTNKGLSDLAKGVWNALVHKVTDTVTAASLGRPGWAPDPTHTEIQAARDSSGASAVEDAATAKGVPVEAQILGEVLPDIGVGQAVGSSGAPAKVEAAAEAEAAAAPAARTAPTEAYNRAKHYGRTPTAADRKAIGAGSGEVADHNPPLVQRYYEGDPNNRREAWVADDTRGEACQCF